MDVRVITPRYQEGQQGFPEGALREATAGREVPEVREHFFRKPRGGEEAAGTSYVSSVAV